MKKKQKTFLLLGNFSFRKNMIHGQTLKCKSLFNLAQKDGINFDYFDLEKLYLNKLTVLFLIYKMIISKKIIFITPLRGFKFISVIIFLLRKKESTYIQVGSTTLDFIKNSLFFREITKKYKFIYTEINSQINSNNIKWLPNFRTTNFYPDVNINDKKFKLIFLARICKEKGVDFVFELSQFLSSNSYTKDIEIDFYGPISNDYQNRFYNQLLSHSNCRYKGIISENLYEIVSQYNLSILPTFYEGEGLPGTIIDSYVSGVPVIVSNWKYLPEFVIHNKTGYIFDLDKTNDLFATVDFLIKNPKINIELKQYALKYSEKFKINNFIVH